ncbi:MAG: hypothetical protein H6719_07800 [Sandaracinaceae bacterium]|nr:hypothetical protein [Sandaracinaceae bacterium]
MTIAYLTDVEGQWPKVESFCRDNPLVRLEGDRLELADGARFVFGGDAIDRGPHARRVVACLTDARERYGERVVLLAGNRDLNKLRLRRELGGHPSERAPEDVRGDRVALLRWTFERTMGAPDAFEHRRAELGDASDEDVVESYLADVANDGALTRYLRLCTLAHRDGPTLFTHGGVGEESLCTVPSPDGPRVVRDLDAWIAELDLWYRGQLDAYAASAVEPDGAPGWEAIIDYQRPAPGRRGNPRSVVYSCLSDPSNDPFLPSAPAIDRMRAAGVERLVVGHTPSGDTPSVLRDPDRGFTLIIADNNYGRVESASRVAIEPDAVHIDGVAVLDDDRRCDVSFTLVTGEPTPVGLRVGDGPLVKAPLGADAYLTLRYLPRYELQQRALPAHALRDLTPPYERT